MSRLETPAVRAGTIPHMAMPITRLLTVVCAAGLVLSTAHLSAQATQTGQPSAPPLPSIRVDFDTTVNPCQDFYRYVTGGWENRTQIPEGKKGITAFSEANTRAQAVLGDLLEQARKTLLETKDPTIKLLGAYYASCMTDTHTDSIMTALAVADTPKKRWCRTTIERELQNAFSYAYIQTVMPLTAQKRSEAMLVTLKAGTRKLLQEISWMSDSTKKITVSKLDEMRMTIGSPDHWVDYSTLTLSPTDFMQNRQAIQDFEWKQTLNAIGGPPEAPAWEFQPYTVNAMNARDKNALELPAAMFQLPFFDASADDASNYGAIGWIIAHEIMHGYDIIGMRFYTEGAEGHWWAPADTIIFGQKTQALVAQYAAYTVFDSLHIDGQKTLAENIADLGGAMVAYNALEQTLQGNSHTLIDGMTPEQRFFVAMARVWRAKYAPQIQHSVLESSHAPPSARVNVVLSNMPAFAKTYGCKAGDPMAPMGDRRVEIW